VHVCWWSWAKILSDEMWWEWVVLSDYLPPIVHAYCLNIIVDNTPRILCIFVNFWLRPQSKFYTPTNRNDARSFNVPCLPPQLLSTTLLPLALAGHHRTRIHHLRCILWAILHEICSIHASITSSEGPTVTRESRQQGTLHTWVSVIDILRMS
jgi:hypothetical protein